MKRYFMVIGLAGLTCLAEAQLKTYVTLEGGPQWSQISVADPGGYFEKANVKGSMAGITVGQELWPNISLVTGLYYQSYMDGINMVDQRPGQSRWNSYAAILVPLRAEYRVQISAFPVSITPRLGYVYGRISAPENLYQPSRILTAPDGTALAYSVSRLYGSDRLHMLEVGAGLNLRFHEIWQASLNLSYLAGFTEPLTLSVDYSDPGGNAMQATYTTKGNTLFTSLAFNVPVSNIWQKKDYRIRKRIENSVYEGKPTDRKGQFYLGGELGSLWRSFITTNPAIGARPLENRGLFRYANFHGGIYAGYMITEDVGVDLGINYQRSSTFFSFMYDHEVDYVDRFKAPLFLEIPVRIRYFYDVYKKKLHYVVYGGISLLTHFSSGTYNQGGVSFAYTSPYTGTTTNATATWSAERIARLRPVLRLGTGAEYLLPMRFPVIATLYLNYLNGFMSNDEIIIETTLPEIPAESSVRYNGSGWSLDVGVKIPFRIVERGSCAKLPERSDN